MSPELTSKRLKEAETTDMGDTDRMSSLPDSILSHILSFLPTKTSVSTMSLVSRRWRHLWEHQQVFDFSDNSKCNCKRPNKFRNFAFFVNSVLSLRKSRDIKKFHLCCRTTDVYNFPGDCVSMWVRAAIGPHLEELSLNIPNCHGDELVQLPPSLLNCTNLVSLSLAGSLYIDFEPFSIHFPSLKMLKLGEIGIVRNHMPVEDFGKYNLDSILTFLCGCPVLETLDSYIVSAFLTQVRVPPSAKKLKLTNEDFSWTCFQIDDYDDDSFTKTTLGIIGNLRSVEEAYLDIFSLRESEFVDPLLIYLQDLNRDLHLLLRHSKFKWPLQTPILNYPEFCNLHHLKFILPCFDTELVLNVLEKCHMLQVLIIQSSKVEPPPLRTWEPKSITVPKCLESHLTFIHIEGYQGFEDELAFVEYILRNGLVLDTMLILFYTSMDPTNKNCCIKRLNNIPRGFVRCQLKFDSAVSP
ncbi:FBD-associated F-box protein [Trifolium repens]|nr:FBD-associated F-box protein [Trifolium repens]